ncbi:hypothetical protein H2200_003500 [Cladophialophora chaetospira]|uniref:Uncharacterized protein n=1 Tax=Cladophialophora chaetospira TaxID=386627 RepID=A0AA38XHG5_9EURO|nr:hypothetical protein H2200_003500 [Cladophialophora chaetospira]
MGLIKSALLVGGGFYAGKKYTQSHQNGSPQQGPNYNSRDQQQYFDNNGSQQQQYYYPADEKREQQPQQKVVPMEFTDRRSQSSEKEQQQSQAQYLLTNNSNAPVPAYGYDAQSREGRRSSAFFNKGEKMINKFLEVNGRQS